MPQGCSHIVHTQHRALCANGRSLGIVHADVFHLCALGVAGAEERQCFLYSEAASSATSFWGIALKAELPVRFRRRILRSCLYSGPMKPNRRRKQRKAYLSFPVSRSLAVMRLVPGHLAQGADEVVVGLDLLRRGRPGKPGKGDLRLADFDGQFLHPQGFADQLPFAAVMSLRFCSAVSRTGWQAWRCTARPLRRETVLHSRCLDRLRLGGEALAVQRFDEVFDLLAVGTVIKGDAAIAVDGEVVHLVGEAGCAQVFGRAPVISLMAVTSRLRSAPVRLYRRVISRSSLIFGSHIFALRPQISSQIETWDCRIMWEIIVY